MLCFFVFKQKTAYEVRISNWSSDVCSSDLRRVIGDRMRQDSGVRLGMRHVETAAERVAQLMMQDDRRRTQYHACEPASVKRLRPRLVVAPIFREPGEALVKRSYALFGHHPHDRISIDDIKAFQSEEHHD